MDKEINDLIDKIALETNKQEAIFQINQSSIRPNEKLYCIDANEYGGLLFVAELLTYSLLFIFASNKESKK